MTKTFDEVLAEAKGYTSVDSYCSASGIGADLISDKWEFVVESIAFDIRRAVACDQSLWYVVGEDGSHIHIGDVVTNGCEKHHVIGFGLRNPIQTVEYEDGWDPAGKVKKVVVDTQARKLLVETLNDIHVWLKNDPENDRPLERIAEKAIAKAMELGANNAGIA